ADSRDQSASLGAAVNRHKFADAIAIADPGLCALALVLEVLGGHTNAAERIESVVFADPGGAFDVQVGDQPGSRANLDFGSDDTVRSDIGAFRDVRRQIDNGGRVNGHRYAVTPAAGGSALSASLHITSASATTTPFTVATP